MSADGPAAWDIDRVAAWLTSIEGVDPAIGDAVRANEVVST
jgi:hypothetical protein